MSDFLQFDQSTDELLLDDNSSHLLLNAVDTGTIAVTLDDASLAGTGVVVPRGTIAVTLSDATLDAVGKRGAGGNAAVTLDDLVADFYGWKGLHQYGRNWTATVQAGATTAPGERGTTLAVMAFGRTTAEVTDG